LLEQAGWQDRRTACPHIVKQGLPCAHNGIWQSMQVVMLAIHAEWLYLKTQFGTQSCAGPDTNQLPFSHLDLEDSVRLSPKKNRPFFGTMNKL
jgi:hypothetical protein